MHSTYILELQTVELRGILESFKTHLMYKKSKDQLVQKAIGTRI